MARLLGHRLTKGAATDKPDLMLPRHISTLPIAEIKLRHEAAAITKRSLGLSCWLFTSKAAIPSENPDC
jgi:hypothetical protein